MRGQFYKMNKKKRKRNQNPRYKKIPSSLSLRTLSSLSANSKPSIRAYSLFLYPLSDSRPFAARIEAERRDLAPPSTRDEAFPFPSASAIEGRNPSSPDLPHLSRWTPIRRRTKADAEFGVLNCFSLILKLVRLPICTLSC